MPGDPHSVAWRSSKIVLSADRGQPCNQFEIGRRTLLMAGAGTFLVGKRGIATVAATDGSPAAIAGTRWTRKSDWRFGTAAGNNIRQFGDWLRSGWYVNHPTQTFLNDECETYNTRDLGDDNPNFQPFSDHCDLVAIWNGGPIASAKGNGSISSLSLNYDVPSPNAIGYYELACKIPSVSGAWPAWWTIGHRPGSDHSSVWGPEIDIFEFQDTKSGTYVSTLHGGRTPSRCFMRAGGNPPAKAETANAVYEGNHSWNMGNFVYKPGIDFAQAYHRFGARIDANYHITLWVDDVEVGTFAADQYCDDEGRPVGVQLIVNLALGTHNPDPVASIHTADFGGVNDTSAANRFRFSLRNIQIWGP